MGEYKRIDYEKIIKDKQEKIRQRKKLKEKFRNKKIGEQLFEQQAEKLFNPITRENEKIISEYKVGNQALLDSQQKILDAQQNFTGVLQEKMLDWPYEFSTDKSSYSIDKSRTYSTDDPIILNLDKNLNDNDKEILSEYNFLLPSVIGFNKNDIQGVLNKIEHYNRSMGQYLSHKYTPKDEIAKQKVDGYKLLQPVLVKYKQAVLDLQRGEKYAGKGLKKRVIQKRPRGRPKGRQTIYYQTPEDLVYKLDEYITSKDSGNTGLDDIIIDILDELLSIKVINKLDYDKIFKNNFPNYIK